MAPFSNELGELFHEFASAQVGAADTSKLAKCAGRNSILEGKIGDVHGHAVLVQGARYRGNDARYPTQDKNRTFQKIPCFTNTGKGHAGPQRGTG